MNTHSDTPLVRTPVVRLYKRRESDGATIRAGQDGFLLPRREHSGVARAWRSKYTRHVGLKQRRKATSHA